MDPIPDFADPTLNLEADEAILVVGGVTEDPPFVGFAPVGMIAPLGDDLNQHPTDGEA